jgi:WbqC-like protein
VPERKLVAIHQPNFLPWLGFFDKIRRSDVFVVMDNAQFSKTGGTWSNRVQMIVNGEPAWITVPIVRAYHGLRTVREMRINDQQPWRDKVLRTVEHSYRRAPHFGDVYPVLGELVRHPTSELAEYNLTAIQTLCRALQLDTPLVLGSSLQADGHATDLLISMVRAAGGNAYLAGGGASGYQEDEKFREAGLELAHQLFHHPTYPQLNTDGFKPGLSIVDALMNCGFDGVRDLLAVEAT